MRTTSGRNTIVAFACIVACSGVCMDGIEDVALDASLTVSTQLPERTRHVLVQEAESIWRVAGVRIRWVDHEDRHDVDARPPLRVAIVRHGDGRVPDDRTVGELVRAANGTAIAFASIARAEQVVRAAGTGASQAVPESIRHHRLGIVLGRAVAHEIGHYLLENGAHTGHGLMRAAFQPREFVDLRSGGFEVDDTSQRLIRGRWTLPLPLPPAAPTQSARCCR